MSRDYYDRLMDQLLRETLGGDRPRDLTTRVMALAKAHDRTRRNWWLSAGAAMAAGIAIVVSLWAFWPQQYPAPVPSNLLVYGSEKDIGPGTRFEAPEDSSGSISLGGGYVNMEVAPSTSFTLGGGPRFQEKVFLEGGHLDVTTKRRGVFELVIGSATVQLSGSKLGVDVSDVIDDNQSRIVKRLVVKVLEGSAIVRGVDTPETLNAGESQTFTISTDTRPHLVEPPAPQATPQAPAGRGRGAARRSSISVAGPDAPRFAQIQVIIGQGPYGLYGVLRHLGPYYVLQSDHGNFMLGTIDTFPDRQAPNPGPQSFVHVVFGKGHVTRIDSISALPSPALQAPASAVPTVSTQLRL